MKRFSFLLLAGMLAMPVITRAQDAATEERLNKLSAQMDVLIEAKDAQNKRIDELARQVRELQEQAGKPNASYATPEDLKRLADKLKEVDDKRVADNESVVKTIEKLGKNLGAAPIKRTVPTAVPNTGDSSPTSAIPSEGFEYIVQSGDTLGAIVKAYRDKNIKVTIQQVLNANPGLKPESMKVGQKIFIPAPKQ